jgi:hypothetical protein
VRRYIKGLYHEMNDWIEINRLRCSQLLLYSTMYAEDYMTQFLDDLLVAIYRNIIDKENVIIYDNVSLTVKLLGRYCKPLGYQELLISAIRNEVAAFYSFTQNGATKTFGLLFYGAIELMPTTVDICYKVEGIMNDFIKAVDEILLDGLDIDLAGYLMDTLDVMVEGLLKKKAEGLDDIHRFTAPYLRPILIMAIRCLGVFYAFKINGKEDPENITKSKAKVFRVMDALTELSEHPEENYFKAQLPSIMTEYFSSLNMGQLGTFAVQSDKWRLYYALFELMTPELLRIEVTPTDPSNPIYRRAPKPEPINHDYTPGDWDDYHDRGPNLGRGPTPTEEKSIEAPATEEPATQEPATEKKTTEEPATEEPTKDKEIRFRDVEDEGEDLDELPVVCTLTDEEKKKIDEFKQENKERRVKE